MSIITEQLKNKSNIMKQILRIESIMKKYYLFLNESQSFHRQRLHRQSLQQRHHRQ
jgi:hypothetical protein